jgi:hypothetical protein
MIGPDDVDSSIVSGRGISRPPHKGQRSTSSRYSARNRMDGHDRPGRLVDAPWAKVRCPLDTVGYRLVGGVDGVVLTHGAVINLVGSGQTHGRQAGRPDGASVAGRRHP